MCKGVAHGAEERRMMPKRSSFANSCSATLSCSGERRREREKRGGPVVCKKCLVWCLGFGQEEVGGEVTEGNRPSKEEMEEAKEGREVGVGGGGVGMEERTGMEGRMEEKTGKVGVGGGVEEGNKTLLCLRSI